MNVRNISVFAFLLIFLSTGLFAQGGDPKWTVGFNLGSAEVSGGDADLEFRTDARGAYSFHQRFSLEAEVLRAHSILDSYMDAVLVNAVFELSGDKAFSPYVLVGAGAARVTDYDYFDYDDHDHRFGHRHDDRDSETGSAFQAALGARYYFGEARTMGLRVELSSLVENTDVFESDNHTSLTAGMTWRFGG